MRFGLRLPRPLFDADDKNPGGPPAQALTRDEVQAIAEATLKRNGADTNGATVALFTQKLEEIADLRRQLAASQAETAAAKTPEGAVVLTGDEAKAYNELKAREGYDASPLAKAKADLDAAATSAQELAALRTKEAYGAAAQKLGLNADALARYVPGLKLEDVDVTANGKTEKVPHVVAEDGTKKPLADVLAADHAALMPALKAAPPNGAPAAPRAGTFPAQPAAPSSSPSQADGEDLVGAFLAKQRAAARPDLVKAEA